MMEPMVGAHDRIEPPRPSLLTSDSVALVGRRWLVEGTPRAAVVIAHGFGAHAEEPSVVATAVALRDRGLDVIAYDARGHGGSGGSSTLGDLEQHDVAAGVLLAGQRSDRVVVVGASMGAIAVLRFASEHRSTAGVVAVSCPARWVLPRTPKAFAAALMTRTAAGRAVAARAMRVRIARDWTDPAPPVDLVHRLDEPVAIVHGAADSFIPVDAASELYGYANDPRSLRIVDGMGHAFSEAALEPVCDAVDWVIAESVSRS
jgi:alpha-beta hydrolase superfamily lysophospholipase